MADNIIFALWFFLPAGIANASPVFANKIPLINKWNTPIDLGKCYRGKRILGDNKRWRGLVFGIVMGALTSLLIYSVYPESANQLSIATQNPAIYMFTLGGILGFGALSGDVVESFFKRQSGKKPGTSWFPFDQIDYIIGGLTMVGLIGYVTLEVQQIIWIFITWLGIHLISSYVGYKIGLKDKPI